MRPVVKVKSTDQDDRLNAILDVIAAFPCDEYFSSHLGQTQQYQRVVVSKFQKSLCEKLEGAFPLLTWYMEHSPCDNQRDSIDIYGDSLDFVVAIELDKARADQVAKKFVSRVAIMPERKLYFLSLCYPGTQNMNLNECIKYFGYCSQLTKRMSGVYAGLIVAKV